MTTREAALEAKHTEKIEQQVAASTTVLTAARFRILDGSGQAVMRIGSNPIGDNLVHSMGAIMSQLQGIENHQITDPTIKNPNETPFISRYIEVHPPLKQEALKELGKLLTSKVAAVHCKTIGADGVALYDNRGNMQPVSPVDGGEVIARLLPADMPQ